LKTSPRRNLVGREAELDALEEHLQALDAGEGRVLFVIGEPGIGKTALITEARERGRQRGYEIFGGRAAEFERDLPFAIFTDALDQELGSLDEAQLRSLDDEDLALLGTVFSSLGRPRAATKPDERHRLLGAMRVLLESLADKHPLVLALDDLHWADAASIDLICHLLHRGIGGPVLLVLASRPAQSPSRLLTAFEEAERHGHGQLVELLPLSAAEATQLLGAEIDPSLHEVLYQESGGNPFYLEQLAAASRHGAHVGQLEGEDPEAGLPAAVSAVIQRELQGLSAAAMTLLQGAAVASEPFEPEPAGEIAGMETGEALRGLDELLDSDLIRPADVPGQFRFRHPILRRAVYQGTRGGWRLAAHARAAASLAARGASPAARAHHVERSARLGDAAAASVLSEAGQEAAAHAPASAARWFEAALRLIPKRRANLDLRLELLGQRAASLGVAGQLEESRETLGIFLQLSPQRPSPLRLQVAVLAAILDELLGTHAKGRKLLLDELAMLTNQRSAEAAEVKRELAFTCFFDADWAAMGEWARQSLAAQADGMVRVGALSALALAQYGLGDIAGVRRSVLEAAELFDDLSDEEVAAHHPGIAIWLGWAEVCTECFDEAIRHLERCIAISRTSGQRHLTVALLAVEALAMTEKGRIAELVEVAEGAVEGALLSASDLFLSWAMTVRCQASIHTGDLYAAVRFGERGATADAGILSPLSGIARLQLASALLEIGEPERAREQLVASDGQPDLPPFPVYETLCYELLVRAELALGSQERADQFAARAEEAARRLGLRVPAAHARRARAMVLLERGQAKEAAEKALAASAAAEQAGAPVEGARCQTLAGRALAAAGDREHAITELKDAHQQLSGCGAWRYSDEAARELRKLGRAVSRAGGSAGGSSSVNGLTRRELEVIEHVAAGRTNREIAGELFLSVRTVDRHLSRIFEKLGVNSRAAATSVFERARSEQPPRTD
jgi:DNA-binding CsgD family transcriptional regulator